MHGKPPSKRYLDVDELLDAGIDGLCTLNIQHRGASTTSSH